jgi:hypothetical protein
MIINMVLFSLVLIAFISLICMYGILTSFELRENFNDGKWMMQLIDPIYGGGGFLIPIVYQQASSNSKPEPVKFSNQVVQAAQQPSDSQP